MNKESAIIYSLLGGIVPALIWLAFWLKEDSKKPEPSSRLLHTFLAGMLAVILVIPLERYVGKYFAELAFMSFFLWAIMEEIFKLGAGYVGGIGTKDDDEPIDPLIYMITAALGFVALENALFILGTLSDTDLILINQNVNIALTTGGLRFIGASLLHIVASGTVGLLLSLAFYKSPRSKLAYAGMGLGLAIIFHTAFNIFVLGQRGGEIFYTLSVVWFGIALLLLMFEKVKTIARQ